MPVELQKKRHIVRLVDRRAGMGRNRNGYLAVGAGQNELQRRDTVSKHLLGLLGIRMWSASQFLERAGRGKGREGAEERGEGQRRGRDTNVCC
mmetsp:Transcript_13196/g.27203  ORF Transcript_13196/g.27203 Transcript_13196/m.27203 type:complete len:93 (+) Transcript_13196:636-914(+)